MMHDSETNTRRLAALVRELVAAGPYEHLADLTYDVRDRCRRLRLPCDDDALTAAYGLVDSNLPITPRPRRPTNPRHVETPQPPDPIAKADAPALLKRIEAGVAARHERRAS